MAILDIILLLILFGFAVSGFCFGFIRTFGALLGTVVGLWIAWSYYELLGRFLLPFLLGRTSLAKVIAFLIIFVLIANVIGLVFWLLNKIFKLVSVIPLLKTLNRLLGTILGLVEGLLVTGVILWIISKYSLPPFFDGAFTSSRIAPLLLKAAEVLSLFWPEVIKRLKLII